MLYELYLYFDINFFSYVSVRAFFSFIIAFLLSILFLEKFIKYAGNKILQPIYDDAPKRHQEKKTTPTMGGVFFLLASIISALLCVDISNNYFLIGLFSIILFMGIGIKDDLGKVFAHNNQSGLNAKTKLLLQALFSLIIGGLLFFIDFNCFLYVPFYKYPLMNMGVYIVFFWVLVIVSTSNAINLTDGLDGLVSFPAFLTILSLSIILFIGGNFSFSSYLLLPFIDGSSELVVLSSAIAGGILGFLWFNAHPASIFMGDSGSLPLGAFIGYLAIVAKSEFLLFLIGFVFIVNALSVILQVGSFKLRKKRIFLMAPLHHHFELKGLAENKIIIRFWIVSLLMNILALLSLKFR
jgi:phospho-N-acetylmuramoyl-pentapeptide-transferase